MTPGVVSRWLHGRRAATVLPARAAYDLWSASYPASAHTPLMRVEQAVIEPLLARIRAKSALDVGTGSGRYLPLLAGTQSRRVIGLDLSLAMLTRHPSAFPRTCADALRLPFRDATFDLAVSSLMAGDIEHLDVWLRELARVLAIGGQVIYSDFHPSWAANGWRRTFESEDHSTIDVPYFAHTMDDHVTAIEGAGLRVAAIREPRLDGEDTRSRTMRRRWGRLPVLVIAHAVKAGPAPAR